MRRSIVGTKFMNARFDGPIETRIRVLPDLTSGPEVRQIFKIRTYWKLDIFLPGLLTLVKIKSKSNFFFSIFFQIFLCLSICLRPLTPNLCHTT